MPEVLCKSNIISQKSANTSKQRWRSFIQCQLGIAQHTLPLGFMSHHYIRKPEQKIKWTFTKLVFILSPLDINDCKTLIIGYYCLEILMFQSLAHPVPFWAHSLNSPWPHSRSPKHNVLFLCSLLDMFYFPCSLLHGKLCFISVEHQKCPLDSYCI